MRKATKVNTSKLQKGETLAQRLSRLDTGDELVLMLDRDPTRALRELLQEAPGRYDFSPLVRGPALWAYHFAARSADDPRSVFAYLAWDHDRLDELLKTALAAAAAGNWGDCRRNLEPFRHGLFRHIHLEDEILFPAFDERTGLHGHGPTAVMRAEHIEIKKAVDEMALAARNESLDALETWHANLLGVLVEHNMKEEQILYPGTDQLLSDGLRDALVRLLLLD